MTLSKKALLLAIVLAAPFVPAWFERERTWSASASPEDSPAPAPAPVNVVARPEDEASDVTILLSGREDGLMQPCGCTSPQTGGLGRRAVLVERAKKSAKAFAAISIGDTLEVAKGDRRQDGFKAELFRAALGSMGYAGQLLGPHDLEGMIDGLLTPYGEDNSKPRPPLNVMIKRGGPLALLSSVQPILRFKLTLPSGDLPVRAFSVVDPTVRDALIGYGSIETVNPPAATIATLPKEPGLLIVAAHGTREDLAMIVREATAKADVAIVVDVAGEVASKKPVRNWPFERGLLVTFEGQGKEVVLVRLRKSAKGFTANADVVPLDPEPYERPDMPEMKAVSRLFDVYRRRVRDDRVLEQMGSFPDTEGQPTWVGSAACEACHPGIYEDWKSTPHSHAMKTLEEHDSAFDPECVVCHTVGWMQADKGGWGRRESSFQTLSKSPGLTDVGCENCHGPGSRHIADPDRKDVFGPKGAKWTDDRMWRTPGAGRCGTCHDIDNSHGFNQPDGYKTYLEMVDHRSVTTGRTVWSRVPGGKVEKPPVPPAPDAGPGAQPPKRDDPPPK